ncbi:Adenine-specific methyltransferase domain-containing protein [Desulfonema limicola]|uniref:Adenine-specific methyltransferase domain-containing protein n=2 Tax=Desulfonema limicola TaxID=45656 RepID=A0A975B8A9_9BACT|nr:Adenine-specific methyltransferase domain-containing protein [Desulfonema limicola]
MGVPITFLHKFNPDQFEIIKFRKGDDEKDLSINGKCPYFRILIKNKRIQTECIDLTEKEKTMYNKSFNRTAGNQSFQGIAVKAPCNSLNYRQKGDRY